MNKDEHGSHLNSISSVELLHLVQNTLYFYNHINTIDRFWMIKVCQMFGQR